MNRYQVKLKTKAWTDPGPDLLRTEENAIHQVVSLLRPMVRYSWRKQLPSGWSPWREVGKRRQVKLFLQDAIGNVADDALGEIATRKGSVKVIIRARDITVKSLPDATKDAMSANALVLAHSSNAEFAGCFVCKDSANNSPPRLGVYPSDHAWGDAVDHTPRAPLTNDALFDWERRMAVEGLLPSEMLLGSQRGQVVNATKANRWAVRIGGADSSHLWHVHNSCHIHTGLPPCAR